LRLALRREENDKGSSRDATRQSQTYPGIPHGISTSRSLGCGRRSLAIGTGAIPEPTGPAV